MDKKEIKPIREEGTNPILPESKVPTGLFFNLLYDTGKPQVLKHAIDFKVFNYLFEPISAEEVAEKLETKPEPTSRLLDMLVLLGMVTKRDGKYSNTPLAEEYLVEGKPTYMGDMYVMSVDMWEGMVAQMPQALKSGIPEMAPEQVLSEDFWASQTDMNGRCQRAMWSYKAIPMVLKMLEFPHFKRMLDLGGSAGIFTAALVSGHPTLKGVVFDQPAVVETTKKIISEYELQDRISMLAGDITKNDFGNDYDLVWICDCLNLSADKLESIFDKVYKSMNPGGVCISQHAVVNKDRTWPRNAAWMSHLMAFAGQDMTLYETDISDAMLKAGFRSVESRYVEDYWGVDRVDIARKQKEDKKN